MKLRKKDAERQIIPSSGKKKKKKIIIIAAVTLIVIIGAVFLLTRNKVSKDKANEIMTTHASYGDIVLSVTGSGTVEPNDRYEIVPLVTGEILSCNYEVGDTVNEDDILYVFDHSEQDKQIESAQNALTTAKIRNKQYLDTTEYNKTLAKYTVKAKSDGVISGFNLKVDDEVAAKGNYGTIQDQQTFKAVIPFNAAQCEKISIGDRATVNLYPSMYSVSGTVTYKSTASSGYSSGAVVYDVEITVSGEKIALTDTSASATVHTSSGDVDSPKSGKIEYEDPVNISPEVSGKILRIGTGIKNGATVKKGDILFEIDKSDFLEEKRLAEFEYEDLKINLENAHDKLENYEIKAPINGTIITKNSKKGDTISGGESVKLMVVADMSAMKFTFQADETDVDKLKVGQSVQVTADAVENKVFIGEVTSIATEGKSENGVSYYPVEVVISDYGQNDTDGALRSGMNVTAEIIYEHAENELCVPVSAITKFGNDSYVFVKSGKISGSANSSDKVKETFAENDSSNKNSEENAENRESAIENMISEMVPDGFTPVKVETGPTDGVNIAIISGITEQDEIYIDENNNVLAQITYQGMSSNEEGFGGPGGGYIMPRG